MNTGQAEGTGVHAKRPLVLLVDSRPTVHNIVWRLLEREARTRVMTDAHGLSALSWGMDEKLGLILFDVQMLSMDGYRMCQIIRESFAYQGIPILFYWQAWTFDTMRGRPPIQLTLFPSPSRRENSFLS